MWIKQLHATFPGFIQILSIMLRNIGLATGMRTIDTMRTGTHGHLNILNSILRITTY